jgi:hypothetical protein
MLSLRDITHLEDAILDASSLRGRPMNSVSHLLGWDRSDIKDQVSNLAVENICSSITKSAICSIWITID